MLIAVDCVSEAERVESCRERGRNKKQGAGSKTLPGSETLPRGLRGSETPGETLAGSETPSDKPQIGVRLGDWQEFWREVAKDTSEKFQCV